MREEWCPGIKNGLVVQWLGHTTVNRSIGVQVPAFPLGK